MLKVTADALVRLEESYPGIRHSIEAIEHAILPGCFSCNSADVAQVTVGVIGRSLALAGATSKIRLVANGPIAGKYRCNACQRFYDLATTPDGV